METLRAFLLTRHWRDTPEGLEISLWGISDAGPLRIVSNQEDAVFFIPGDTPPSKSAPLAAGGGERRSLALSNFSGARVDGLYFRRQGDLLEARTRLRGLGVETLESDIKPVDRFLMERFITAGFAARGQVKRREGYLEMRNPAVRKDDYRRRPTRVSLDIETEGLDGSLYSVALHAPQDERVLMVSERPVHCDEVAVEVFPDERALLTRLFAWFAEHDPDMIIGWSVIAFDLDFIARRCERLAIPFDLARGFERSAVLRPGDRSALHIARIPGRVVLDGIESLRGAFRIFESFDLETVARELLGRGKKIDQVEDRVDKISHLYRHDRPRLAAYNIEDCRLVDEIFERTELVEFSMRRAELTGLSMDRYGGSVAAFDNLYLPRLHRAGRVAPDVDGAPAGGESPGGYVLDSKPGIYDNVIVLDFKSLYPSIIRTFGIDPHALHAPGDDRIEGFSGASFAREAAILPGIVHRLWEERDRAKARGDDAMSQATKILMNSFYGILGAAGCRFRDTRLASSITRRGHEIIRRTRDAIEKEGLSVIYGDTDSLFVLLGGQTSEEEARACGTRLSSILNEKWKRSILKEHALECHLEIEFETHFLKFLMPTVRGDSTGSKKRYAGLVRDAKGEYELIFKGLESVRTDWTPLARRFQRELYRRVFVGEPFEDYIRTLVAEMLEGRHDDSLIYRKRLRRRLDEYTRNAPPHVQAARKLGTEKRLRQVRYIVTAQGPEPVREGQPLPLPDYEHYRSRQLAPAANGLLHFLDTSFESISDRQMEIFR